MPPTSLPKFIPSRLHCPLSNSLSGLYGLQKKNTNPTWENAHDARRPSLGNYKYAFPIRLYPKLHMEYSFLKPSFTANMHKNTTKNTSKADLESRMGQKTIFGHTWAYNARKKRCSANSNTAKPSTHAASIFPHRSRSIEILA